VDINGFQNFLSIFEDMVSEMVSSGLIGTMTELTRRAGKNSASTEFRSLLGSDIESNIVFAVDYYGYIKRSTALTRLFETMQERTLPSQVKAMNVPMVFFNSIPVQLVASLYPEWLSVFEEFKSFMVSQRFNTPGEKWRKHFQGRK
jgi:hypothetical protein